jgi:ArsR family transcriptional regulator, arsenate/arsenite/antimonite-responsive transcriptional repressor
MQLAESETGTPAGGASVVGPSLALDLSWALHTAWKDPLPPAQVEVSALYTARPALIEAVRGFWNDDLVCFTELEVVASWAGALEVVEFDALASQLSAAVDTVPDDLSIESETARDHAIVRDRLAELRRSASRRRRWLGLFAQVWEELDEPWRRNGVPRVERVVGDARRRLERGDEWTSIVGFQCDLFQSHLPGIVERHRAGRPLMVVPCAFFGKALYVETARCIVVGVGVAGVDAASRARTAEMARRLRAVADPTRLAMLDFLADGTHTVGDIARSFSLAQPTVSSHVKHLREAGLVRAERRGARIEVSLDREAVEGLAGELGGLLAR